MINYIYWLKLNESIIILSNMNYFNSNTKQHTVKYYLI